LNGLKKICDDYFVNGQFKTILFQEIEFSLYFLHSYVFENEEMEVREIHFSRNCEPRYGKKIEFDITNMHLLGNIIGCRLSALFLPLPTFFQFNVQYKSIRDLVKLFTDRVNIL